MGFGSSAVPVDVDYNGVGNHSPPRPIDLRLLTAKPEDAASEIPVTLGVLGI